jgi:GDP-L-galactose phosphorylase
MTLTIKRVPTVVSIHQLDEDENDPKASLVRGVCAPGSALPTLSTAPRRAAIKAMKKVRSFGSFDDLRVPDLASERDSASEASFDGSGAFARAPASDDGSCSDGDTGSTGGGYVQDVSPFDRILLSAWEDRFAAGLFRYDVTAVKTKVVPGGCGFVAQFNEGRATKKRPTEFSVDEVCQAYDANKFNFTKADKSEILFAFRDARAEEEAREDPERTGDLFVNTVMTVTQTAPIPVTPARRSTPRASSKTTGCRPRWCSSTSRPSSTATSYCARAFWRVCRSASRPRRFCLRC